MYILGYWLLAGLGGFILVRTLKQHKERGAEDEQNHGLHDPDCSGGGMGKQQRPVPLEHDRARLDRLEKRHKALVRKLHKDKKGAKNGIQGNDVSVPDKHGNNHGGKPDSPAGNGEGREPVITDKEGKNE